MKILIVSDTHGSHRSLEEVLERERDIGMMIHLGDVEGGADYIEALVDCPLHIIAGNNDFFSDLPREKEIFVENHHIFITHGHAYYVSLDETRLRREALGRGADIVMYGHLHRPSYTEEGGLIILNPGSIAYPRQAGRRGTYMIMDTGVAGSIKVELKYV